MEEILFKPEPKHYAVLKVILSILGIVVVGAAFLVIYKGSDVQQAMTGSETLSGSMKESSGSEELINGISVPPEPDSTISNSTLAGIDSNSNGVRDDVERFIAKEFGKNRAEFSEAFLFSRAEQAAMLEPTPENVATYTRAVDCSTMTADQLDKVTLALLNTPERSSAYGAANAGTSGGACETEPGQSAGLEVINGISVPPEPDPAINNSTLAGVDSNSNGVRDDVERILAGASKKSTFEAQTLPIAQLYQELATSILTSPEEVVSLTNKIYCFEIKRPSIERQLFSAEGIKYITNNTPGRVSNANANEVLVTTKPALIEGGLSCPS